MPFGLMVILHAKPVTFDSFKRIIKQPMFLAKSYTLENKEKHGRTVVTFYNLQD